jgi:hypothetical protein
MIFQLAIDIIFSFTVIRIRFRSKWMKNFLLPFGQGINLKGEEKNEI